jgi:hypothetical protein
MFPENFPPCPCEGGIAGLAYGVAAATTHCGAGPEMSRQSDSQALWSSVCNNRTSLNIGYSYIEDVVGGIRSISTWLH